MKTSIIDIFEAWQEVQVAIQEKDLTTNLN